MNRNRTLLDNKQGMLKDRQSVFLLWILLCGMIFFLPARAESEITFVSIWNAPEDSSSSGSLDFSQAPRTTQMERSGFERGISDYRNGLHLKEILLSETSDLSNMSYILSDLYNENPILMAVGASSDMPTMYASMVTNFFNIPFLVPFADGDLDSGSGAVYVVRLTPDSQIYADYFGKTVFPENLIRQINSVAFGDDPVPDYDLTAAVFFEDNSNGQNTSVKITQVMMDHGLNIELYKPFDDDGLMPVIADNSAEEKAALYNIDIVVIIGEDKDDLSELTDFLSQWDERQNPPTVLLLGCNPFTANPANTALYNYSNVFVVRQSLDLSQCPEDISGRFEAMGYAAGVIMMKALKEASEKQPAEPTGWRLWFKTNEQKAQTHQDYLDAYRSDIREAISMRNEHIPCYGKVNLGVNAENQAKIELVRFIAQGEVQQVDPSVIFYRLVDRVLE